jgi:hypothetical protein
MDAFMQSPVSEATVRGVLSLAESRPPVPAPEAKALQSLPTVLTLTPYLAADDALYILENSLFRAALHKRDAVANRSRHPASHSGARTLQVHSIDVVFKLMDAARESHGGAHPSNLPRLPHPLLRSALNAGSMLLAVVRVPYAPFYEEGKRNLQRVSQ